MKYRLMLFRIMLVAHHLHSDDGKLSTCLKIHCIMVINKMQKQTINYDL